MTTTGASGPNDAPPAANATACPSGERFLALTEQAQCDLAMMLDYLTKTNLGVTLDQQKVAEATRLCAADVRELSDAERTRIWTLIDEFSPLMKGMTIEGLRLAQPHAMRVYVSRWLSVFILAAFVITLSLQYWALLGTKAVEHLESTDRKRMQTVDAINTMENANPELAKAMEREQRLALSTEYAHLRDRYDAIVTELCNAYHGLYQLNVIGATLVAWLNFSSPAAYWGYEGTCGAPPPRCEWRGKALECEPGELGRVQVRYGSEVMARASLEALKSLILPSLFATLGACMRVLRDRLQQYRERKIEPVQPWETRVRILLGTVVGSVLGFFYTPEFVGGQLAAIPLLGLAFFAGYNVDLLFLLFDKLANWWRMKAGRPEGSEQQGGS